MADVLDVDSLTAAREQLLAAWGRVDILLNTAGGNVARARTDRTTVFALPFDAFDEAVRLNLHGTVYPSLIFGEAMARPGEEARGSIVNISSMAALQAISGVMAYSVARRRNEIGIRVALGATRAAIVGMIVREVALLVTVGLTAGLVLSVFAAKSAASLLFGVTPTNAPALALGGVTLAVIAAIASILPAQRAATLNPTSALREEA